MTPEEKLKICMSCGLMRQDPIYGPKCDNNKYMNPTTGEISRIPHAGWVRGCGCNLKYRTKSPTAHCINGKW